MMIEFVALAMSLTDKLLDKMPDYSQGKKEKYYQIKRKYVREMSKDTPYRDDVRIDEYRDQLLVFLKSFNSEISE